jgi:signal transduction histidine kinase
VPAELKAVDLDEAVNQALDSCLPVLTANNVQVVAAPSGEYLYVAAQLLLLRQALVNVITNAAQAMPNGGCLRVSARKNRRFGIVTISDTGPGIPAEHVGRIFDPFFTTKDVGDGFGLGLSITYEIIHRQGGDITVDTSEGKGTTLTVRLPLFEKEGSTHE